VGKVKGNVANTEKVIQGLAHKPLPPDGIRLSDAAVFPHVAVKTYSLNTRNKKTTEIQKGKEGKTY
jgi:hypothetical protein